MFPAIIASGILAVLAFFAFVLSFHVVQEYERGVVFRLGRYLATRGPGVFWTVPIIDATRVIDTRTVTVDVEEQETITRDSVTIKVNAVLWYRVADPSLSVVAVANYRSAVYQVALTTLRNTIGQHDLDELLRERDRIDDVLRQVIDVATDPWGIKVERVEMKDVEIPVGMQRAMAREAEAVREKRARIIKAEAEQDAASKLAAASREIVENPAALELRRMQMISEVGAEQNTTTIILMPSDFVILAKELASSLRRAA
ncbi:MAG TPA: SPFH domain-containing protein [Candidatus Limnocylindria bacterium]|jgi:regulator of protease activity HflC (stomatin/prohibitin superfamily)|nr:SPFH domain-containing protein [Candidatus Limnocylindria bacterium]